MSNERPTEGKKKIHPAVIAGPLVAVAAALGVVFISTNNVPDKTTPAATDADGNAIVSAQSTSPTPAPVGATPVQVGPDGALRYKDEALEFAAIFPEAAPNDVVIRQLQTEARAKLDQYLPEAVAGAADRKANGGDPMRWDLRIDWIYTAKAAGIVSLVGVTYAFTGGAHGMTYTDTHIARTASGEELTFPSMLTQQTLTPALIIAICEALKAEKTKWIGSPTIMDEPIVCAGANSNIPYDEMKIGLAPSTEPDKFGGIYVYFDPYAVGAYVEGSYDLTIPQDVFNLDLRKEFQPLFAGKPVPASP